MYDVDIIIPTYNSINTISIPLDSWKKQKTKYKFRVVIVNDSSITRRNDRLNKFTGLEWYAYNMDWAFNEAKKRGVPQK